MKFKKKVTQIFSMINGYQFKPNSDEKHQNWIKLKQETEKSNSLSQQSSILISKTKIIFDYLTFCIQLLSILSN